MSILLAKTIANCKIVRYNHFRVGAWCSGSTWASDSHGVGSIPIAPANATHPRDERGCFFFLPQGALVRPCGRKRKSTVLRCVALTPKKGAPGKLPNPVREYSYSTRSFYRHSLLLRTRRTRTPLREKKKVHRFAVRCIDSPKRSPREAPEPREGVFL